MLGTVCFRLGAHRTNSCSSSLVHSYTYHSVHPSQVPCRHAACPSLCRSISFPRLHNEGECSGKESGSIQKQCCLSNFCVEKGSKVSCATIWHGLVPSHHPSIWEQDSTTSLKNASSFHPQLQSSFGSQLSVVSNQGNGLSLSHLVSDVLQSSRQRNVYGLKFPDASTLGSGKFAMATGLLDGSWNVAWDVRPARWLHGRHSAWLLFGVRACLPATSGLSVPRPPSPLFQVKPSKEDSSDRGVATNEDAMQGKQVCSDYTITGIPGDGRCLFHAIAYGVCLRKGQLAPDESTQQELADKLRAEVVDELIRRRADCEWFIEEDFDTYTRRMRECYVWGGEPELLMASHVLRAPIIVYLFHKSSGGITSIAEYGSEYGTENPIRVLYHGFGHYDAVQIPGIRARVSCNF